MPVESEEPARDTARHSYLYVINILMTYQIFLEQA